MKDKFKDDSRWSKASFCIYGETLQPDDINRDLGLQATNSGLKGGGQSKYPRARQLRNLHLGYWKALSTNICHCKTSQMVT